MQDVRIQPYTTFANKFVSENIKKSPGYVLARFAVAGSPADHASVEVGDEIIEINGRMLSDVTHEEVVTHIHEVCNIIMFTNT